jgi:hypothetical protein
VDTVKNPANEPAAAVDQNEAEAAELRRLMSDGMDPLTAMQEIAKPQRSSDR